MAPCDVQGNVFVLIQGVGISARLWEWLL